jgi:hypothetical protein
MNDLVAGLCDELCGQVILRALATAMIYPIDWLVVRRRSFIVRHGRQIQQTLNLPNCVCVFTAEEPGMPDGDLRKASLVLSISFFFAGLGLFVTAPLKETLWDSWVLTLGVFNPICVTGGVWLVLLASKRERLSRVQRMTLAETEKLRGECDYGSSLEEDVAQIWTV